MGEWVGLYICQSVPIIGIGLDPDLRKDMIVRTKALRKEGTRIELVEINNQIGYRVLVCRNIAGCSLDFSDKKRETDGLTDERTEMRGRI